MGELQLRDKLELSILEIERKRTAAQKELKNENLTQGQLRALHVEIAQCEFTLKTLKFLKYD